MDKQIKYFYEFGPFRIDTVNRCLLCNGELVPLKAKAVETLLLLVRRNGEVVEKDELMKRLWPDSFVEEANLTQNIYVLRKALGDAQYIETVPRRGYRFAAEVKESADTSLDLIVIKEKTRTSLSYEEEESEDTFELEPVEESRETRKVEEQASTEVAQNLVVVQVPPVESTSRTASRHRRWMVVAFVAGLILAGAFAFWPRGSKSPFAKVKLASFTTTGKAFKAAISADGKYLAYVLSDAGQQSLWLRQVATGKELQIVPPARIEYYGLTFSHDGNYIYYVNQEMNRPGLLFQVPSLGGTPSQLIYDVDSPVTLSPDDKHLAFIRGSLVDIALVIANVDGTDERKLSVSDKSTPFKIGPTWTIPPAWSPDGKTIACPVGINTPEGEQQTIWGFPVDGGQARVLTNERWGTVGRMEWLADGSGLLVTAAEQGDSSRQQIWHIAYPQGTARKITNDLSDYRDLSLTTDAKTLIAVNSERRANIWLASATDTGRVKQITSTNFDGLGGLAWTPDGRLVYTLQAGGEQNLWITDLTGDAPKQLTAHAGFNQHPAVSPDGRYIVFISNRSGQQRLWRIDADGKHPQELTHGVEEGAPSFTPDGKWIIFRSFSSGRAGIFRIAVDGGEPVALAERAFGLPTVSPDGKLVAFFYRTAPTAPNKIAVMPLAGGEIRLICDLPAHHGQLRWMPDGHSIAYAERQGKEGNIWSQPLDGSPPRQLTFWRPDPIFSFDWSRDGKWLAYATGTQTSDVVLISDLQQ